MAAAACEGSAWEDEGLGLNSWGQNTLKRWLAFFEEEKQKSQACCSATCQQLRASLVASASPTFRKPLPGGTRQPGRSSPRPCQLMSAIMCDPTPNRNAARRCPAGLQYFGWSPYLVCKCRTAAACIDGHHRLATLLRNCWRLSRFEISAVMAMWECREYDVRLGSATGRRGLSSARLGRLAKGEGSAPSRGGEWPSSDT